jgi:hypothetical protein
MGKINKMKEINVKNETKKYEASLGKHKNGRIFENFFENLNIF